MTAFANQSSARTSRTADGKSPVHAKQILYVPRHLKIPECRKVRLCQLENNRKAFRGRRRLPRFLKRLATRTSGSRSLRFFCKRDRRRLGDVFRWRRRWRMTYGEVWRALVVVCHLRAGSDLATPCLTSVAARLRSVFARAAINPFFNLLTPTEIDCAGCSDLEKRDVDWERDWLCAYEKKIGLVLFYSIWWDKYFILTVHFVQNRFYLARKLCSWSYFGLISINISRFCIFLRF